MGGNLRQSKVLCLDFFTDEDAIDSGSDGALEGDVRGGATHQANKVVILFGGYDVRAQIANGLRIHFGGSVEAEADWDVLVLEVTVDGLGAANDFAFSLLAGEVLSEKTGIGVGVIAANHNESIEVEFLGIAQGIGKLLGGLDLVSSGT